MEKVLQDKVKRFISLSKKFTKCSDTVLGRADLEATITMGNVLYVSQSGSFVTSSVGDRQEFSYLGGKIKSETPLTKGQVILKEAELKAQLADEYEEYIKLQTDLSEYFEALEKLNIN